MDLPIKQIFVRQSKKNQKIIFLDRDGTLNDEINLLTDESQIKIFDNAFEAIKILNNAGYVVVIVTNQPVVARGLISVEKLKKINDNFFSKFKEKDAIISGIYSCPHHPNADVEIFRVNCKCRKPGTLMLKDAHLTFETTLKNSFMIGDKTSDLEAGKSFNIPSILVKTGYAGKDKLFDIDPDYICDDVYQAVLLVKNKIKR